MDWFSPIYQLVVIAKPSPDRPYCQLASAFQSCSCSQSIQIPFLNALSALSDDSNRVGILQELQFAAEYHGVGASMAMGAGDFYKTSGQKDADSRFPYITATLISSMATSCLDQEHSGYRCSLEKPFHSYLFRDTDETIYEECWANISIGVIDITDLRKPRHCFLKMGMHCIKCGLWWHDQTWGRFGDGPATYYGEEYTPLSCEELVTAMDIKPYSTSPSQHETRDVQPVESRDVEAVEALQHYPLIDITALASCWPSTAWNTTMKTEASSDQAPSSIYQGASNRGARSLSKQAQEIVLDAILSELLDDLDLLNEPMQFRRFPKSFLATCAARADELAAFKNQETIAELLIRLLEGSEYVDLYPFRQLPLSTILQVLHSDSLKNLKSLNLSGLFVGSPEQIWTTLDTIPHQPEVVYLLSPPSPDKAAEEAAVMRSFPTHTGRDTFWERIGSTKIIMSSSISTALLSYGSAHQTATLGWKQKSLGHLRELVSGNTSRLQLVPDTAW